MKIEFNTEADKIGLFEIFKDIVIPSLSIITTLIIGVVIANVLRKREEKSKIKQLLIDNYMEYLVAISANIKFEITNLKYLVLNDILINTEFYLPNNANRHFATSKVKAEAEKVKQKVEILQEESSNWSYYTYRFAFLLGMKKYLKKAQPLEDLIVINFIQSDSRSKFHQVLKNQLKNNEKIMQNLNSMNMYEIDLALNDIEDLISIEYNSHQFRYFNPYSEKIANLIDAY